MSDAPYRVRDTDELRSLRRENMELRDALATAESESMRGNWSRGWREFAYRLTVTVVAATIVRVIILVSGELSEDAAIRAFSRAKPDTCAWYVGSAAIVWWLMVRGAHWRKS